MMTEGREGNMEISSNDVGVLLLLLMILLLMMIVSAVTVVSDAIGVADAVCRQR